MGDGGQKGDQIRIYLQGVFNTDSKAFMRTHKRSGSVQF